DDRAKKYDSIGAAGQWGSEDMVSLIRDEIFNKVKIAKKDRVLEIGCGSGVLGNVIKNKCEFYIGFDTSLLMLKKFQKEGEKGDKPNLIQSTADTIPLRNNFFDIVIMNGVTMYFPNKSFVQKVLAEIERVSCSSTTIFIGENIVPSRYYWELVWFENLSPLLQFFTKPYIKTRKWLANNNYLAGKWKNIHKDISPSILRNYFKGRGDVFVSDAAAYTVRKKLFGRNVKGNRRVDFLIKLKT
ncbi:MAG: class I SAM-dependent methyltransferase, partial [Nitrososphaeraceae archaeon]